jgi:hypothetical protein
MRGSEQAHAILEGSMLGGARRLYAAPRFLGGRQ